VFADSSGAVAVPATQIAEVVAEARRIVADDAGFMEQIRTEDPADVRGDER
jgi:regulator of RNase E activity RraA